MNKIEKEISNAVTGAAARVSENISVAEPLRTLRIC